MAGRTPSAARSHRDAVSLPWAGDLPRFSLQERGIATSSSTSVNRLAKAAPKNQLTLIAQDIASVCGGTLDAVVLSHRHRDHMSGFETRPVTKARRHHPRAQAKAGDQPWTEDPKAKKDATAPTTGQKTNALRIASLDAQRVTVQNVMTEAQMLGASRTGDRDRGALRSVVEEGMEGILNASAVKNLQTMAPPEKHAASSRFTQRPRRRAAQRHDHRPGPPTLSNPTIERALEG
jgi:hypothetical protein